MAENDTEKMSEKKKENVKSVAKKKRKLFTNKFYLRARGRTFALRVASSASGMRWRLGSPRVELRPDGRQ